MVIIKCTVFTFILSDAKFRYYYFASIIINAHTALWSEKYVSNMRDLTILISEEIDLPSEEVVVAL